MSQRQSSSKQATAKQATKAVQPAPVETVQESKKETKQSKKETKEVKQVEQPVATQVQPETATATATATATTTKKVSKKAKQETEPVQETTVQQTEQPSSADDDEQEPEVEQYKTVEEVHKAIIELDKEISTSTRNRVKLEKLLFKLYSKERKLFNKKSKRRSSTDEQPKISGFNKHTIVPDAFCKYLGLEIGVELPRTNVSSRLYKKIAEDNLLDKDDKRLFDNTSEIIRNLFLMKEGEVIKFENFQHYVARVYKAFNGIATTGANEVTVEMDEAEEEESQEEDDYEEEAEA